MKEEEIKSLLASNGTKAFSVIVDEYSERLYWHIRGIVLNHDDADDVVQYVFIKVYQNIHRFEWDSKLYTWMYRIATNESLNFLKSKARRTGISTEELNIQLTKNLSTDAYFDGDESERILQEAVAQLPEKQGLIFKMKYFEQMKYQEMAEILDTSVGSLKASYHHAAKKIEAYVKKSVTL